MKHATVAPVAASIKERLTDIEDLEIMQSQDYLFIFPN